MFLLECFENGTVVALLKSVRSLCRQSYARTFDQLSGTTGLAVDVQYDFPWDGQLQSLLPFSGPAALSLKVLKTDAKLTKYVLKGVYDFNCKSARGLG